METILKVNQLTKKFGKLTAVNQLNFEIKKGNVYGILGPNGSGKSTTLGMVLNVVNVTAGSFEWFGGGVETHDALKKVGAIIESPNFYPNMSAKENLQLVAKIKQIENPDIEGKLSIVGLADRKKDSFKSFSLGMKQRLAIASALLNDPEILILDEPTNGLDPQGIRQIRDIILSIAEKGTTILLASHLLDEVEKICSHVIIIQNGNMLYDGLVDEMTATHGFLEIGATNSEKLKEIITSNSLFGEMNSIGNNKYRVILNEALEADEFNKLAAEKGVYLNHLVKRKESLEESFIEMTK
ncbi:MAG: ABC transporter ATP-binding protein [Bacteroidota bacterium]